MNKGNGLNCFPSLGIQSYRTSDTVSKEIVYVGARVGPSRTEPEKVQLDP